jgi:hypothetical protein
MSAAVSWAKFSEQSSDGSTSDAGVSDARLSCSPRALRKASENSKARRRPSGSSDDDDNDNDDEDDEDDDGSPEATEHGVVRGIIY